jgi:hypothetical protein
MDRSVAELTVPGGPAEGLVPHRRAEGAWSASRGGRLATTAALAACVALGIALFGPRFGMRLPPLTLALLACGAVAMELAPARPFEVATVVGLLTLASTNKVYSIYHLVLVLALFVVRRRTLGLAVVLGGLALALPKHLFGAHYHSPGFYNWINEPSLALALFVTARWWRERRDGRFPEAASPDGPSFPAFAALYFFPGHAVNPMVYGASELHGPRRLDARGVLVALTLVASKAVAHSAIWRWFPGASYAALDGPRADALSWLALWGVVLVNYVDLALTLSGTADLAVAIARLYGWPLPSPFRWALLAWSPVELWRRWGIYNRRFLLGLVYFPLGGGRRWRYRNVLLTFLASALVMHSGWFGSKYWQVGQAGWRDESIYFLLQGIAVCACLLYGEWRGKSAAVGAPRTLRWSWARAAATAATQLASALIHVVILAQAMPIGTRFGVMARCLGLR